MAYGCCTNPLSPITGKATAGARLSASATACPCLNLDLTSRTSLCRMFFCTHFCLPPLESLVMVESAYIRGDIGLGYLRRHLLGNRGGQAREVLARVDRGAGSLLETLARVLFRDAGIRTETQVWIDGVGTVDFLLEGFLIVELDGIAFHLEPRQFKKDRRRDNEATRQGMLVLRFFYDDVVYAPEKMLRHVREVLLRGPARLWSK